MISALQWSKSPKCHNTLVGGQAIEHRLARLDQRRSGVVLDVLQVWCHPSHKFFVVDHLYGSHASCKREICHLGRRMSLCCLSYAQDNCIFLFRRRLSTGNKGMVVYLKKQSFVADKYLYLSHWTLSETVNVYLSHWKCRLDMHPNLHWQIYSPVIL